MSTPFSVHQALDDLLGRVDAGVGAAEAHGLLCGLLCAAQGSVHDAWMAQLVSEDVLVEDDDARFRAIVDETARQLEDAEFGFGLVLPGDDEPLNERATALGEWCHGFLVGLGLGQGGATVSEAVEEVIQDLTQISQVSAQPEDCQTEEDEDSYAELVEYVRVAVLVVNENLLQSPPATNDPPFLH